MCFCFFAFYQCPLLHHFSVVRPVGYTLGHFSEAPGWADEGVQCPLVGSLLNCSHFGSMSFDFLDAVYNRTCKPERKEGIDPENECIALLEFISQVHSKLPSYPQITLGSKSIQPIFVSLIILEGSFIWASHITGLYWWLASTHSPERRQGTVSGVTLEYIELAAVE